MEYPSTIDWFITSICNLKCDYCFGPIPEKNENFKLAFRVACELLKSKSENITLCGGEPFAHPDICELIDFLKKDGKNIRVSTNGHFINKLKSSINDLSSVSISLDASNEMVYKQMRGKDADFNKVLETIYFLSENHPSKLKITSVISKINYHQIIELANFISEFKPKVWRLFQFVPRMKGFDFDEKYNLADEDFYDISTKLIKLYPDMSIFPSNQYQNSTCFILDHLGNILQPCSSGYLKLGNCFEQPIDECWQEKWILKQPHFENKKWIKIMNP